MTKHRLGTSNGAYASAMVKRLKKSGLKGNDLATAIAAIKGDLVTEVKTLPRRIVKRIGQELAASRRAVVVLGTGGGIKVYSLDGYLRSQASAHKNRPWEHKNASVERKAEAAAA